MNAAPANPTTLIVATKNPGKLREIAEYLGRTHPGLAFRSLLDLEDVPRIDEDRDTFLGNAEKKATIIARHFGLLTLADDSGLEVDALNGEPGVFSARYFGLDGNDELNNRKLLEKLEGVSPEKRTARFRCAMVLASPDGRTESAVGEVEGIILGHRQGTGGFGYDPLFLLPDLGVTMAELPLETKNSISHRARALAGIVSRLDRFLLV